MGLTRDKQENIAAYLKWTRKNKKELFGFQKERLMKWQPRLIHSYIHQMKEVKKGKVDNLYRGSIIDPIAAEPVLQHPLVHWTCIDWWSVDWLPIMCRHPLCSCWIRDNELSRSLAAPCDVIVSSIQMSVSCHSITHATNLWTTYTFSHHCSS